MASLNRDEISRLELLHAAHPDGLVFPHLADAYRRAGRYAQAETVLNAGLRRHSDYSSAHVVLGRLRLDQGKHPEAERAFRRVLELDPQNHIAMEYLGRVSLEQGRFQEALDQFRRLARLKPGKEVEERVREIERRVAALRGSEAGTKEPQPHAPGSGNGGAAPAKNGGTLASRETGLAKGEATSDHEAGAPAVDSGSQDEEAPLPTMPEPGEVVTETMAELYTRQGLHDRAASVYRQLLERSPGDPRLEAKLAAVAAELPGAASGDPSPVSIRQHLGTLLDWRPSPSPVAVGPPDADDAAADEADLPAEPWADAAISDPAAEDLSPAAPGGGGAYQAEGPAGHQQDEREERERNSGFDPSEGAPPAHAPEPPKADLATAELPVPQQDTAPAASDAAASAVESPPPYADRQSDPTTGRVPRSAEEGRAGDHPDSLPRGEAAARSLIAITDMLVGLLEYRDPFFRGSSSLTRLIAEKVGDEMGLTPSQRTDLAVAAVLRDLGRLAMGGRLVSQSGQQTPEARRKIERHVDLALGLLEGIDLPPDVRAAVRHHHERWDGAGYPDGLSGEAIPLLARILAVVDSFAAMVSPRSYRLPRKVPDAARELREASGTQYDPAVVAALTGVLDRRDQPHLAFAQRPHLLLVSPDQPGAVVTAAKLCSAGYLAEVSADTTAAGERLRRVPVAALVVSAEAGEEEAAAFVRQLRVDPLFSGLPVIVVDAESVALRVRLLESGADVCFPPGTSHAELQGTLGALVRRTLRGRRSAAGAAAGVDAAQEAPWLALQGDVADFPLTWLLQVMKYDSRTAAIGIRTPSEDGAIYLQKGDAVHAQLRNGEKGEPALRRMLNWEKGRFTVQPDAVPRERTITTSIMHLLLTQAVDEDHASAGIFGAVSETS